MTGIFTLTVGEVTEHDYKSAQHSDGGGLADNGLTTSQLEKLGEWFIEKYPKVEYELIRIGETVPDDLAPTLKSVVSDASVLVIRGGAYALAKDSIVTEMKSSETTSCDIQLRRRVKRGKSVDLFANASIISEFVEKVDFNKQMISHGRLVKKLARWTAVLGPKFIPNTLRIGDDGKPCGDAGSTAIADTPLSRNIVSNLQRALGHCGWSERRLFAEINHYYDSKCSISFHRDLERKIVIGLRFGMVAMPIVFAFFLHQRIKRTSKLSKGCESVGSPFTAVINIRPGDLYVMSESASGVGANCGPGLKSHFRHAAGLEPKAYIPNQLLKPTIGSEPGMKELKAEIILRASKFIN